MKKKNYSAIKYFSLIVIFVFAIFIIGCAEKSDENADKLNEIIITINFNYPLAPEPLKETIKKGEYFYEPNAPIRSGFIFSGWFSDASDGVKIVFPFKAEDDRTLYGQWEELSSIPTGWVTGTSTDGKTRITNPIVHHINTPVAGNYPQSLYKYHIREGTGGYTANDFRQTIDWLPPVTKTFNVDTRYTAVLRLDPETPSTHTFKTITRVQIPGLPSSSNVDSISAEIDGDSIIIYITFPRTGSIKAESQLVFFDEFNGTTLDLTKWDYSPSPSPRTPTTWNPQPWSWIRHGRSTWQTDGDAVRVTHMVEVKEGNLIIHFKRDTIAGEKYASVEPWGYEGQVFSWWPASSGRRLTRQILVDNWISAGAIRSLGRDYNRRMFEHGYGWYESRIKFPRLAGAGAAFWLMSMTFDRPGNQGQFGTEIDILETIASVAGTWDYALHWGMGNDEYGSYVREFFQPNTLNNGQNLNIYDGEFHVFALDWSPSEYVFYINGIEMGRVPDNHVFVRNGQTQTVRVNRNPNYIKLSAETAYWDEPLPAGFTNGEVVIDYVRVYNQPQK